MTEFIAWAGAVCMAAAGCAALHMIVGKNGTGKVYRLLTAAFFLCAVISPLLSVKDMLELPKITTDTADMDALEDMAFEQMTQMTENILLTRVNETLQNYQLEAERIEIRMDTLADGSISITDIFVYIPRENSLHRSWVKEIVTQRLGMEVQVEYVG